MPNTFAPRAMESVVKDRVSRLRIQYEGDAADVKEWHAMLDMMGPKATEDILSEYGRVGRIPHVVSGVGEDGYVPEDDE